MKIFDETVRRQNKKRKTGYNSKKERGYERLWMAEPARFGVSVSLYWLRRRVISRVSQSSLKMYLSKSIVTYSKITQVKVKNIDTYFF